MMFRAPRLLDPAQDRLEPGIDPGMETQNPAWLRPDVSRNPVTLQRFQQKLQKLPLSTLRSLGTEALLQRAKKPSLDAMAETEKQIQRMSKEDLMKLILEGGPKPTELRS